MPMISTIDDFLPDALFRQFRVIVPSDIGFIFNHQDETWVHNINNKSPVYDLLQQTLPFIPSLQDVKCASIIIIPRDNVFRTVLTNPPNNNRNMMLHLNSCNGWSDVDGHIIRSKSNRLIISDSYSKHKVSNCIGHSPFKMLLNIVYSY